MTLRHLLPSHLSPSKRMLIILLLAAASIWLASCAETGQMVDQPYYRPLAESDFFADGRSARSFPSGTVPYSAGSESPNDPALTGLDETGQPVQGFPVEVNQDLLALGQERYNIYCIPCHGPTGEGNGMVTTFGFPKPPSLLTAQNLTNGNIFEIITNGKGKMFPYGYRVKPIERWAVIAYIRALQLRSGEVDPTELTPEEINQIGNQP
jgi:mono/diheme cytochrome c family protein